MPRLLIVSYWFPPLESIGSLRVASFAKHLSGLGWDVGVITVKDGSLVHDGQRCEKAEYAEVHHVPGFSLAVLVRNQPNVPVDVLEKATASMVSKKTAIVIEPERVVSWDHRKLDVAY